MRSRGPAGSRKRKRNSPAPARAFWGLPDARRGERSAWLGRAAPAAPPELEEALDGALLAPLQALVGEFAWGPTALEVLLARLLGAELFEARGALGAPLDAADARAFAAWLARTPSQLLPSRQCMWNSAVQSFASKEPLALEQARAAADAHALAWWPLLVMFFVSRVHTDRSCAGDVSVRDGGTSAAVQLLLHAVADRTRPAHAVVSDRRDTPLATPTHLLWRPEALVNLGAVSEDERAGRRRVFGHVRRAAALRLPMLLRGGLGRDAPLALRFGNLYAGLAQLFERA